MRIIVGGPGPGVMVTSSGWRLAVGDELDAGCGNELASAFAGVLAAADALQATLEPFTTRVRRYRGQVSLWDMAANGNDGPPVPDTIDLDSVAFAACGGVATASLWALALFHLGGTPLLFDPDVIDDEGTNLNRHLTASYADIGAPKAVLGAAMLTRSGAEPSAKRERWNALPNGIDTVVLSPDDDGVRRQVQLDLPNRVLNGGTNDDGIYVVSRHDFLHGACLACIARSDLTDRSPVAAAARRLGVSEEDLAPHVGSDGPLPHSVLAKATALTATERENLSHVSGRDLLEHLCGMVRPTGASPAVSAPMLSAAPGVLLAADVVRSALGRFQPSVTMTSILTGPHQRWTFRREKSPDCVCTDDVYRGHFSRKWSRTAH